MKTCNKCNLTKPLTDFNKRVISKDGYRNECKSCKSIASKKYHIKNQADRCEKSRKYRKDNKEYLIGYHKEYNVKNKESRLSKKKIYSDANKDKRKAYVASNKEKIAKTSREYYIENIEKARKYREENKERRNELVKKWSKTDNGKASILSSFAKRRALQKGTSVNNTDHENYLIRCVYVFSRFKSKVTGIEHHVDHKHPISKGGNHHPSNLQILTATENLSKGARVA